jgi:hypothetical protein
MNALNSLVLFLFGSSWKTSLLGYATAIAIEVANQMQAAPQPGWHFVAAGILMALRAAKDADKTGGTVVASNASVNVPTPRAFATLLAVVVILATSLCLVSVARADDAPPPPAPLTFQLTPDLELHLNVAVVAFSYDLTHKAYLGQGEIGGLYALTSKRLGEAGIVAGGALTFDSKSKPSGELNAGLVSPKIVLSPTLSLHFAALYARRFGDDAASLLRLAPTLEF